MRLCRDCPRECGTDRSRQHGWCGSGEEMRVARAALHFWEEPCISGKNGSGTVFFTGCSLRCVYCQNAKISEDGSAGVPVTVDGLCRIFDSLIAKGAHNINLVTASHFVRPVAQALRQSKLPVPVVYNCGGYESTEALGLLEGLVDIYLPDYKYAQTQLAAALSRAPDYSLIALAAIKEMFRQTGACVYDGDGMLQKGTLVRHLILPGHTKNSIAVLQSIYENFGTALPVSLMAQYTPCKDVPGYPELSRRITRRELEKVEQVLFTLGLQGFVQQRTAAKEEYVPPFDGTGVENTACTAGREENG